MRLCRCYSRCRTWQACRPVLPAGGVPSLPCQRKAHGQACHLQRQVCTRFITTCMRPRCCRCHLQVIRQLQRLRPAHIRRSQQLLLSAQGSRLWALLLLMLTVTKCYMASHSSRTCTWSLGRSRLSCSSQQRRSRSSSRQSSRQRCSCSSSQTISRRHHCSLHCKQCSSSSSSMERGRGSWMAVQGLCKTRPPHDRRSRGWRWLCQGWRRLRLRRWRCRSH